MLHVEIIGGPKTFNLPCPSLPRTDSLGLGLASDSNDLGVSYLFDHKTLEELTCRFTSDVFDDDENSIITGGGHHRESTA